MFRDGIAAHGEDAIRRLAGEAWLLDPHYAAFATRTIRRAGEQGSREAAIQALRSARPRINDERHQADIDDALKALGERGRPAAKTKASSQNTTTVTPMSVDDLVTGSCYHRRSLHRAGLGGNWQRGISYPAHGTYALLFSDPSKVSEYGYKDQPVGGLGYRYFGEWNGAGDMTITGGNQVIVDRSPDLYLFTAASCGQLLLGRFEFVSWERERAARDGRELTAIVFTLRRATGR